MLLRRTDSHVSAKVAGWVQPLPIEAFFLASLFTAWSGEQHPLMPAAAEQSVADIDTRLADIALENMNRR